MDIKKRTISSTAYTWWWWANFLTRPLLFFLQGTGAWNKISLKLLPLYSYSHWWLCISADPHAPDNVGGSNMALTTHPVGYDAILTL